MRWFKVNFKNLTSLTQIQIINLDNFYSTNEYLLKPLQIIKLTHLQNPRNTLTTHPVFQPHLIINDKLAISWVFKQYKITKFNLNWILNILPTNINLKKVEFTFCEIQSIIQQTTPSSQPTQILSPMPFFELSLNLHNLGM